MGEIHELLVWLFLWFGLPGRLLKIVKTSQRFQRIWGLSQKSAHGSLKGGKCRGSEKGVWREGVGMQLTGPKKQQKKIPKNCVPLLIRNERVSPAPHIQDKNMNKYLDIICAKMLQNKANSTVLQPYVCSYFCLVCLDVSVRAIRIRIR